MGKSSFLIVMGLIITVGIFGAVMNRNSTSAIDNSTSYFSREAARNANNAAMQIALRQIADSTTWRAGYHKLVVSGSNVRLTATDSINGTNTWIKVQSKTAYYSDSSRKRMDTLTTTAVVQSGFVPWSLRGAFTAFGPLDWTISDMLIDGRDHTSSVLASGPPILFTPVPNNGIFGISTGAPVFVNSQFAEIGGSVLTQNPKPDYAPAFPNNPAIIETSSPWPNGFPKDPDAALGWPKGTLIAIAKSGKNGSRYISSQAQFDALIKSNLPLQGVTYFDVPPADTQWQHKKLPAGSGGILVFHCETKSAYWKWIESSVTNQVFVGMMIFDRIHHIHINVLGGIIQLTANTVAEGCQGNKDKTIAYSSKVIQDLTGSVANKVKGGWRNKLKVISWQE